jgi:hypothetical protein
MGAQHIISNSTYETDQRIACSRRADIEQPLALENSSRKGRKAEQRKHGGKSQTSESESGTTAVEIQSEPAK